MKTAPWEKGVEEIKFNCPKLAQEQICEVHKQFGEDIDIISFKCPQLSKKGQCLNPDHSPEYHEKCKENQFHYNCAS